MEKINKDTVIGLMYPGTVAAWPIKPEHLHEPERSILLHWDEVRDFIERVQKAMPATCDADIMGPSFGMEARSILSKIEEAGK